MPKLHSICYQKFITNDINDQSKCVETKKKTHSIIVKSIRSLFRSERRVHFPRGSTYYLQLLIRCPLITFANFRSLFFLGPFFFDNVSYVQIIIFHVTVS